jgi:hypothetical protein
VEEGLIKRLMTSVECNACGQRYEADDIEVIGHHEELWFLRAVCSACHAQSIVAAVVKEGKAPQLITDLTDAELDKFGNIDILTDDVLDMHNFLEDFNGDFSRLFSQK